MKIVLCAAFAFLISSLSAYAGQPIITETETGITVEYTGTPDNSPTVGNAKEAAPESKPANPSAPEVQAETPQTPREVSSEVKEAREARDAKRVEREARRAEKAARRGKSTPSGYDGE